MAALNKMFGTKRILDEIYLFLLIWALVNRYINIGKYLLLDMDESWEHLD